MIPHTKLLTGTELACWKASPAQKCAKSRSSSSFQRTCQLLLLLVIGSANYVESVSGSVPTPSSLASQNSARRLKLCVKSNPGLPKEDIIELPTFSVDTLRYNLEKHAVDRDGDFFVCPNGEKPVLQTASASKPEVDKEFEAVEYNVGLIFLMLRSATFLFQNGYLSVGVDEVSTYYSPLEYCIESIKGQGIEKIIEFRTCPFAKERPALPKCCPLGMALGNKTCIVPPEGPAWDPKYLDAKTYKLISISEANPVYTSPRLQCWEGVSPETWFANDCSLSFHPVTDDRMAFIGARRSWEFIPLNTSMCIDLHIPGDVPPQTVLFHCAGSSIGKNQDDKVQVSLLYMICMYIGATFHLVTTLVYLITWKKQNIHLKTLSSLTMSLFFMYIFLGNAHLIGRFKYLRWEPGCIVNSVGGQYFMIAAFTWLLVVNVDLWRTFRSIRADNPNSLKRFLKYSAWGWGFPLVITIISICLEITFRCRTSGVPVPDYGQHYCFLAPWAQGLYAYYILSVLIVLVIIFAVLTMFGLYSFKKDTSNLRSSKGNDEAQTILLFLKLVVVMGLSWVFEVISWAVTNDDNEDGRIGVIWIIFDLYNLLSAILIFVIFVCKRNTLNLLEQSCPMLKGLTAAVSKFASGEASDNTNSTAVGGNGNSTNSVEGRKKSSAVSLKVHFTKKTKQGSDNTVFE